MRREGEIQGWGHGTLLGNLLSGERGGGRWQVNMPDLTQSAGERNGSTEAGAVRHYNTTSLGPQRCRGGCHQEPQPNFTPIHERKKGTNLGSMNPQSSHSSLGKRRIKKAEVVLLWPQAEGSVYKMTIATLRAETLGKRLNTEEYTCTALAALSTRQVTDMEPGPIPLPTSTDVCSCNIS